jgi:hypothetical protein
MELWVGIGAMLAINIAGWLYSYFRVSAQEAKEMGALRQKVDDLKVEIEDGLTDEVRCLDRRLRNIEIKLGAGES